MSPFKAPCPTCKHWRQEECKLPYTLKGKVENTPEAKEAYLECLCWQSRKSRDMLAAKERRSASELGVAMREFCEEAMTRSQKTHREGHARGEGEERMTRSQKTETLIAEAQMILMDQNPMTVRQVYYQLVSRQVIENTRGAYQAVSNALVQARKEGLIVWDWIEDRTRRPRHVSMWNDLADFLTTVRQSYRRAVWQTQNVYLEAWLEKDALSGLFERVLDPYGVSLNVGRGYDGWTSIRDAAQRIRRAAKPTTILYFGDFDPSGEDMARSLTERLAWFDCWPAFIKCALTLKDVERYRLPPAFNKKSDSREKNFTARYGDQASVELDALPWKILKKRIITEIEKHMDMEALAETKRQESWDNTRLEKIVDEARGGTPK